MFVDKSASLLIKRKPAQRDVMFIGRKQELAVLSELSKKSVASLVVCKGRRRIGKSSLANQFGQTQKKFFQFQGLSPRKGQENHHQLNHFAEQLANQAGVPGLAFRSWSEAFDSLCSFIQSERTLVLLDEISWMAAHDKDFAGRLKIAWDTKFSKKKKLILIVCGSVSSWIEKNILNAADFVGRISATIDLKELSLRESNQFIDPNHRLGSTEVAKILAVTGGVPRYLEEVQPKLTADQNIKNFCFSPEGFLFTEFEKIFNDIFDSRAVKYRTIVRLLVRGHMSVSQICEHLKVEQNGVISGYLEDLEHSGFLARDFNHALGQNKASKLSQYRLADNYLRFYLRYIEPERSKIQKNLYRDTHLGSLSNWNTVMGLQVENLIHANTGDILEVLGIDPHQVRHAGPHFQNKTAKNRGACQIDLLIETKRNLAYVCEIKFRKKISSAIISEVQKKIENLKKPKNIAVRPVLIYDGELEDEEAISEYFDAVISFKDLLF